MSEAPIESAPTAISMRKKKGSNLPSSSSIVSAISKNKYIAKVEAEMKRQLELAKAKDIANAAYKKMGQTKKILAEQEKSEEEKQLGDDDGKNVVWFKCVLQNASRLVVVSKTSTYKSFLELISESFFGVIEAETKSDNFQVQCKFIDQHGEKLALDTQDRLDKAIHLAERTERSFVLIYCSVHDRNDHEIDGNL